MGNNIIGMKYNSTAVRLTPDNVQKVSKVICDSAQNIETEYKSLLELENTLYGETGGNLSTDFQNTIENIDQYAEIIKKKLMEISETVKGYADRMKEADIKAAGGGVYYEQLPVQ